METISELLSKAVPITVLAFGISSMVAVGSSLTVRQILDLLGDGKLVCPALPANSLLILLGALGLG